MAVFSNDKIQFKEVQQFRQSWIWILLIFSSVTSILLPLLVGLQSAKDKSSVVWVVSGIIVLQAVNMLLFYVTKFETVVTNKGVYYRWSPFFKRYTFLSFNDIASVNAVKWTYMHWGYSKTKKFGKAHTISGDKGVLVEMKNDSKYYIGSQKAVALLASCEQMMENPLKYS